MNGSVGWRWFWRGAGVLGILTMLAILADTWTSLRSVNVVPVTEGRPVRDGLDIISIQLDILSLVIAVASIGLGVAGVVGYQAIKAAAMAKADEVATKAVALHIQKQSKNGTDGEPQKAIEPGNVTELTEEEKGD